jgi:hypothetical protein
MRAQGPLEKPRDLIGKLLGKARRLLLNGAAEGNGFEGGCRRKRRGNDKQRDNGENRESAFNILLRRLIPISR